VVLLEKDDVTPGARQPAGSKQSRGTAAYDNNLVHESASFTGGACWCQTSRGLVDILDWFDSVFLPRSARQDQNFLPRASQVPRKVIQNDSPINRTSSQNDCRRTYSRSYLNLCRRVMSRAA